MVSSRLAAASRRALLCAGVLSILTAPVASIAAQRLGAPYEAGGVWFVPAADPGYDVQGVAGEYSGPKDGATYSGERFDARALTAAHATLPVPGVVEVTNLDSGKTLSVRINDRGPYVAGRILSLSPAAARALGVPKDGQARVRVRYADAPTQSWAAAGGLDVAPKPFTQAGVSAGGSAVTSRFDVQVGAFSERARADRVALEVSAAGPSQVTAVQRGGATLYRVTVGPLADANAAETVRGRVGGLGYDGAQVIAAP
jgi:rare lipoprotein A